MSKDKKAKDFNELVERYDEIKKKDKMDLSSDQDLSIALMNLISIEEHFFFTAAKTKKDEYYDLLREVREIRKVLLKKIIKEYEGEVWCISKHLLAASMRLMEVGTKQLGIGNKKEAKELFEKAYDLYSLFWGLNMNIIDSDTIKMIDSDKINKHDKNYKENRNNKKIKNKALGSNASKNTLKASSKSDKKKSFTEKLGDLVRKAIDCCIE